MAIRPGKIIAWGLGLFVAAVSAFVIYGMMLPTVFAVKRSIPIEASVEQVHAIVGDLEQWPRWTPWSAADASLKVEAGAQTTGVGATQTWVGKDGEGSLVFTRSDPQSGVSFDFLMGEGGKSQGEINYRPVSNGVIVEWLMSGEINVPVLGGYIVKMIESQSAPMFDEGLRNLKREAESK